MKKDSQLKYPEITFIKEMKDICSVLVLKDGRIAIGTEHLKIYSQKTFDFDFEISLKNYLGKDGKFFNFSKLIYLNNNNILINDAGKIFFIIKIYDNEKKYDVLEKFESKRSFSWINRICVLSNNSIATIGVHFDIEFFSKNEDNKYYSSKIIKDAHKRDGYKTLIEIPNNRIMTFSGKLREFKVWDLNNYECVFRGEISEPDCYGDKIYLILNRYVLIRCIFQFTIIDIDNNYKQYSALETGSANSMLRLDEKEFLILTEQRIKKISLKIDELKFKVDNSKDFYSKEGYRLGGILVKIKDDTYLTNFAKNGYSSEEGCDTPLLIFKYYNN